MRVVLVAPRTDTYRVDNVLLPPIGLGYVAASALRAGHEVHLLDQALPGIRTEARLVRAAVDLHPQVLGISTITATHPRGLRIAAMVKAATGCTVVLGGVHATHCWEESLREPQIDLVVRGEGEFAFTEILGAIEQGTPPEAVAGVAHRDRTGRPVAGATRERNTNLDALPWPTRPDALDTYRFDGLTAGRGPLARVDEVSGSRDCSHGCRFCVPEYPGRRRWIGRSARQVVDEMAFLAGHRRVDFVFLGDPDFGHSRSRVEAICEELLSRQVGIRWGCFLRCDEVTQPLASLMARAGCVFASIGIETGTDQALGAINKRLTLRHIRETVQTLARSEIQIHGNLIVGFPWDDRPTVEQSLDFYRQLPLDVFGINFAVPYPGTDLHRIALEENLIVDRNLARWTNNYPVMRTRHLDLAELDALYRRSTRAFYLRPTYASHVLERILSRPARLLDYARIARHAVRIVRFGGTHRISD